MGDLIKEERYVFVVGTEEHVLRVQELVWRSTPWPERFRIHVPTNLSRSGKKFYGATAREAVGLALEYLSSHLCEGVSLPTNLRPPN